MPTPIDISKKLNELEQDLEQAVDSFISKGQEIISGWSLTSCITSSQVE